MSKLKVIKQEIPAAQIFKKLVGDFELQLTALINEHGVDSVIGLEDYRISRKCIIWLAMMRNRENGMKPDLALAIEELMEEDTDDEHPTIP